ncbi:hypothetical protein [Reyranella sp. CPCC 100927]|uniref:hypothetical protein n=1 Tax=Reyranella sp. CPCC 100927 TaxID=2599616 RepID=UPI0011B6C031|nr:hypothetical protein [Reyranella sp. CPCC 100927]TWT11607.1 hypothetical protein FQU96_14105 [Reyranella sp. CPCC 100927]
MAVSGTIVAESIELPDGESSAVTWSAIIAGAVVGLAATIAMVTLGLGIGLALYDPWAPVGSSAKQLSIGAVIWFITAQLWGLFVGGYVAGRLRRHAISGSTDETRFRDAAHGAAVWAMALIIGVMLSVVVTVSAARTVGQAVAAGASTAAAGVAAVDDGEIGVLVRQLTRSGQPGGTEVRPQEIVEILRRSWMRGEMAASDRDYLAGIVAQRTGIAEAEAKERVARAEQQVRDAVQQAEQRAKEAADKAKRTGAFTAFWGFIALLLGCTGAVGGALLGGAHRREV